MRFKNVVQYIHLPIDVAMSDIEVEQPFKVENAPQQDVSQYIDMVVINYVDSTTINYCRS